MHGLRTHDKPRFTFMLPSKASAKIKKKKRKAEKRDRIRNQPKQISPSAAKRARQSVKRRIYNRARITQVKIGVNKVLEALKILKNKTVAQPDEVFAIEKLIEEAHSVIDKAVKIGTLHRKTGARRKSRLARRKKAVELHHGLV
ncbi:30S ribosomal protein S20, chloroplastic [Heracleum sosnowskyi]|uniref:30S ribosomal protein S20, chloroplastic n=1 Tax=Heracleum sosnowskyi TaxID=360622 RepID=A0AAD8HJ19_9APIA|nr:30S ribosomal protein S20, chloroplastic [Heracleum sosnowskyi]KAK1367114.1 30S ribosomal protein S20, chloroplastic [Heracleum sosnowskyi]